ncbi:MAG: hypothetical protein GC181_12440 [Bacteroidetes bacterium]|nr:hypothetical protein [Bacteroidota bacterium]
MSNIKQQKIKQHLGVVMWLMVLLFPGCKSEPVKLELNLEKGKEYTIRYVEKSFVSRDTNSLTGVGNLNFRYRMNMVFRVKEIKDLSYMMEVEYQKLDYGYLANNGMVIFSSDDTVSSGIVPIGFQGMINRPFNIEISKRGKVISVDNLDSMIRNVLYRKMAGAQYYQVEEVRRIVFFFGESGLKEVLTHVFTIYPKGVVKVGDFWNKRILYKGGIPSNWVNEYSLQSVSDTSTTVAVKTSILPTEKGVPSWFHDQNMEFMATGNSDGEIRLEPGSGWIKYSKSEQDIKAKFAGNNEIYSRPPVLWIRGVTEVVGSVR